MNAPQVAAFAVSRRRSLAAVSIVVLLAAAGWAAWSWSNASGEESTDNAYVQGDVVHVTPQVDGTVVAVLADETGFVRAGDVLVQLDPAEATVAVNQAEAGLGQAVRQVRALYAQDASLTAQIALRQAEMGKAASDVARAEEDFRRRSGLAESGAVSKEEVHHANIALANARSALAAAQAGVQAAREQLAGNRTQTDGTSVEAHPSVQAAAARLREAWLLRRRLAVAAPVAGHVAKRTVQLGQRVTAGAPLMSIIPLGAVWVEANFKEAQLRNIRIGQPVTLTADVYGAQVRYDGRVVGLGAGTGAAFALLPAQNATGNWIKVVQRVPVRIALTPAQVAAHPLRVGLSMQVTVDASRRDGAMLAAGATGAPAPRGQLAPALDAEAEAAVRRVIRSHDGSPASRAAPAPAARGPAASASLQRSD